MAQNLRTEHVFVTGKTGGAVGIPGVTQTGAGTINSDPISAPRDKTVSIIGKITKTGGTLAATVKIQCSNLTDDEVKEGTADDWVDEGSLTSQVVGDATTSFAFKITRSIFKRYRINIVFTGGNSSTVARTAV